MNSNAYRLDRFISQHTVHSLSDVRLLIAQKRILVDGVAADSIRQRITKFTQVELDGVCLNNNKPVYLMLNKPKGIVSATKDDKHTTVLDLIDHPQKADLHIVGRLDFNTTGLVLLTNDGAWSRQVSLPATKLSKTYLVTLGQPFSEELRVGICAGHLLCVRKYDHPTCQLRHSRCAHGKACAGGGKYHQVKRMFGFFDNEVLTLHRTHVGAIALGDLAPGQARELTAAEVKAVS